MEQIPDDQVVKIYLLAPPCFKQAKDPVWIGYYQDGGACALWNNFLSSIFTASNISEAIETFTRQHFNRKLLDNLTYCRQDYVDCLKGIRGKLVWSYGQEGSSSGAGRCETKTCQCDSYQLA